MGTRSCFFSIYAKLASALFLGMVLSLASTPVLAHDEVHIDIEGGFWPATVDIRPGTTVEWQNKEHKAHTIISEIGAFSSGVIPKSGKYSYTFTVAGTYVYTDQYSSFKGTIRVAGSSDTTPPSAAPPPEPVTAPNPNPISSPSPAPSFMSIGDNYFAPASFSTTVGTLITWTNGGQKPHSVTSDAGLFDSGMLNPGQSFSFTFQTPGTYSYHCIFHNGQAGIVTVNGNGNSPTSSTPPNQAPTSSQPTPVPASTPTQGTNAIQIGDNLYSPATLPLVAGTTVTWTNIGHLPHTVTSDSGAFDSGMLSPGQSFSFTFQSPGTYSYRCAFHDGQAGIVTVNGNSNSPTSSTPPNQAPTSSQPTPVPASAPTQEGSGIQVGDNLYSPATLPLVTGTRVTWTNNGRFPHTVTSDTGVFDSGMLKPGQSFSFTFQSPGTYSYYCVYHRGQVGTVMVTDGSLATAAPLPHGTQNTAMDNASNTESSTFDQSTKAVAEANDSKMLARFVALAFVAIAALGFSMGRLAGVFQRRKRA